MAGDDWLYEISDDESDHRDPDISDSDGELNHGTSQRSQLPPVPGALPFLDYRRWAPGQSYDEQPSRLMLYTMQWKLTLNNRKAVEQTEQNLVVAPSDFWKEVLASKIAEIVASKKKSYETSATTIVMSVPNDRSEDKITKHFLGQQIDWTVIERQLQGWSQLLRAGKRLKVYVQLDYVESASTGRPAGRGATAIGLAERTARMDAERDAAGEVDPWRRVYQLMRCPGAPCDNGQWCWQDRARKMHHKLLDHHMRELVRWVQQGHKLETHDDVPEEIRAQLYAQEQQGRKRKRQASGSDPTSHVPVIIHNHISDYSTSSNRASPDHGSSPPPRLSPLCVPGLRDDAVEAYCEWHRSKVRSETQKQHFELAYSLTIARGLDLELVHEDNDAQFYIEQGVLEGVARRWVRDIQVYIDQEQVVLVA
ncbi:hypothetical protein CGMCC3_g12947 [Colletotrichum fructicola]|uniref:Uncharacterized protein n=2 Tax=Colletotrichum fructicola (strain Nara gc5) TaxID=1213859 RepID=A0A7J6JC70_COLFN|nr:uncharacterized protein CGMCC3_g12947 [Colletotrichum fructicola]KAE9571015.1 hypothetical protein CGMCC3_g12947 [Colletotrichum fructicola]KAF4486766.1 hypothetical protein CGGC5_v005826 [Colletotrichum fructicola Nara gc5]KAF4486968.1 hypothetical protein CGGC5_v005944 [Colletotrichum fructicola Nara gc5]